MYYRGSKVSLSGKEPKLYSFKVAVKREEPPKRGGKWVSSNLFKGKEEVPERVETQARTFYRPSLERAESKPEARESSRFRLPEMVWFREYRWVLRILILVVIGGAVAWSKVRTTDLLQKLVDLRLSRVSVEGIHYLTEGQVLQAAHPPAGQSMFQLDLEGTGERVRQLDWVERAYVERRLPQSLLISIRERKPVALLDRGDLYGVDAEGRVLSASAALLREDLPIFSGIQVPPEAVGTTLLASALKPALDFLAFLQKKDAVLAQDVSEVNMGEAGCLKATFIDGIEAKFNPVVTEAELKRMAVVVSDLAGKGKRAGTLDFRYRDMVLVKTR
jgi:cell division protein FtsQ